ncbi:histone deacetylase HDT1-like [Pyrus ussuriensis x Pyrus communis]|uniref:Histone deacetylase HDT1-like n=1 Tax=Pyrus ussuriensis x Pyrus communis TaxID=2448454 RepID=A0A5N5HNV3_9ROSA|nr:histone deacetylase HDT1-like [Pyrus ussuriensis x Pyrus communis]
MLQMPLDLAFGKAFGLSHNMKNRSVHFSGYHTCIGDKYPFSDDYSDSLGFQLSLCIQEYGNINSLSFATLITCCVPTFDYEDHDSEIEDDDSAIQDQEEISTLKKFGIYLEGI